MGYSFSFDFNVPENCTPTELKKKKKHTHFLACTHTRQKDEPGNFLLTRVQYDLSCKVTGDGDDNDFFLFTLSTLIPQLVN